MKLKWITLCTIAMIGLLFVFAMMDVGISNRITNIPSRGIYAIINRLGFTEYSISETRFIARKLGHFVFYALLSPMIAIVLIKKFNKLVLSVVFSSALTLVLAFMDEFIQYYARGRNASYFDIVIDMAGAMTGLLIFTITACVLKKRMKTPDRKSLEQYQLGFRENK